MKNLLLVLIFCLGAGYASAQVGIGTATPNQSAQLEVLAADKGVLIPRIALTSTVDKETIANGNVESLLVYNTTNTNLITPGYYYWYNEKWRRLSASGDTTNQVIYDPETDQFYYITEDGDLVNIEIGDLLNETISRLVDNGDGSYTYTDEEGVETIINVPEAVINEFTEITQNNNVLNQLVSIVHKHGGNVYYDGDSFSYTDENGENVEISIEDLLEETVKIGRAHV